MPTSQRKKAAQNALPMDILGAGDTELVHPLLPDDLASTAFSDLVREVNWRTMLHRGGEVPRLVAVQGASLPDPTLPGVEAFPIYRHPADSPPDFLQERFTPTVEKIRRIAAEQIGHELNHVLIQHYRGGQDYISEHSDKTLDVVRGTKIVNVSLGAERVMTLRQKSKRDAGGTGPATLVPAPEDNAESSSVASTPQERPPPRPTQRIPLPHNSLFVMGPETNKTFLHGIKHDNRPEKTKSEAELANGGERISLTFRFIGTWLVPLPRDPESPQKYLIYGQGAKSKTREGANLVPPPPSTLQAEGDSPHPDKETIEKEVEATIRAFGEENFSPDFDWDKWYGEGFDVVSFV